jgi:hypothetical protein
MKNIRTRAVFYIACMLMFFLQFSQAQTVYSIDASQAVSKVRPGHYKMGDAGLAGKEIIINNRYLSAGGIPQIPVMGEMHFSRLPKERWEEVILKMKAAGINIISTYLFWIHHEEIEGQFDWSGNKDLRSFVQLCAKHDLWVCPRIGPWAHGEVRNGGTPDWILTKKNLKNRTNDPVYQLYVSKYFEQIGEQLKGLLYKEGGPVMCIQLENEYTRGQKGEPHIKWLKETAIKYGMDVPMYTVTGWGDGSVPAGEVIPLWGGYPDQPWDPSIEKMTGCGDFEFNPFRNDDKIGNGLAKKKDEYMDYSNEPFFTCEMGVGVQMTRHRRSVISRYDGLAMTTNRIGSGSNLLGYYVFAGGSNPTGTLSAMNEDMDETGNWSETPAISYDFQAAIGESGLLAPSYYETKKLNYFLNEFGKELAPMEPFFSTTKGDLQYVVRADEKSAFLFGINYCRFEAKPRRNAVQFRIKFKGEEIKFPSQPVTIEDSSIFIWPVNMLLNDVTLKYATAQPLCKLTDDKGEEISIFFQSLKDAPEFCFDGAAIAKVECAKGKVKLVNNSWLVTSLQSGTGCEIIITAKSGRRQRILVLTKTQSLQAWLLKEQDKKYFILSDETIGLYHDELTITGPDNKQALSILGSSITIPGMTRTGTDGLFSVYQNAVPLRSPQLRYTQKKMLDDAQWLKTSVDYIEERNRLYHKLFVKEFNLGNPSAVKSALLYMIAPTPVRIQVNNVWVNQSIDTARLVPVDITGYVKKGENSLMMDFPFVKGDHSFAARLMVEYFNTDQTGFVTDTSWRLAEQYYYPAPLGTFANYFSTPQVTPAPSRINDSYSGFSEFVVDVPCNYLDGLNNLYLSAKYTGMRSELRLHHKLIADNYNNNTTWNVDLKRNGSQLECRSLLLRVFPVTANDKVLFDLPLAKGDYGKSVINTFKAIPEYRSVFYLKNDKK